MQSDLVHLAPHLGEECAIKLVVDLYGLDVEAAPLPSERDQNFLVTGEDGGRYVLKIANADESRAILHLQNETMAFLGGAHGADGSCCPLVVPTTDGHTIAEATVDGVTHFVRLLTYLPGQPLATVRPHSSALQRSLGTFFGRLDRRLLDFHNEAAARDFHWDLRHAGDVVTRHKNLLSNEERAIVAYFLDLYECDIRPQLSQLRKSIIHGDGNDYNVLVQFDDDWGPTVTGVIDFGDMVCSHTVNEVAISAAYAMMDKADPLAAAAHVVAGYHAELPLTEDEVAVLFGLIGMRLCTSVCMAAVQRVQAPENEYLSISQGPAWALLKALRNIHPRYAWYVLRDACGLPPRPQTPPLTEWLRSRQSSMAPVFDAGLMSSGAMVLDLSVGTDLLAGADLDAGLPTLAARVQAAMAESGALVAIGRHDEARLLYRAEQFANESDERPERRTIHLGVDLFVSPGSAVYAPLAGVVQSVQNNDTPLDYGPTVILRHECDAGPFFTLYGHLGIDALQRLRPGQAIDAGSQIGTIGNADINGGWPPHLHFQLLTDLLGEEGNFPGVASPTYREVWTSISPDPSVLLGISADHSSDRGRNAQSILESRRRNLGKSLSISYGRPLHIVRGWKQFLYDVDGRAYLDGVNNVCHVGHCHPHVVRAGQRQMTVLNTNTRYLHDNIVDYAERLLAKFPDPFSVVFFVCSGSEANELALRMARIYTGREDILMLDAAYHGNTQALIDISPYKHDGRGGRGAPAWAHKIAMPDPYRGLHTGYGPETGAAYAEHVRQTANDLQSQGRDSAAFIAESVLGCGGQIVLPDGYLAEAYRHVHAAGGVCIADEVQVGFGRVGSHFWGFETQDVVPDIVTLGKPIGNGHPLAAVVTTPAIADAFANGMEYFNTFGGNPVSCAIGMAVLDVIEEEGLQENALRSGNRLMEGLRDLSDRHPLVGDVRGLGLFVGAELVLDRETREPAPRHAAYIAGRMRDHGILISTDGPDHNVLKLKPPIVFDGDDADRLVTTLDKVLQEDCLGVG